MPVVSFPSGFAGVSRPWLDAFNLNLGLVRFFPEDCYSRTFVGKETYGIYLPPSQ